MNKRGFSTFHFWAACFVVVFPYPAWSQLPHTLWFHSLTAEEGLLQSYNWYVYHDSEGFVWISSISGLNRFDGVSVRHYYAIKNDTTSLLGESIYSGFFEDKRQNIWFSTPEAIHCYVRQRDNFRRFFLLDHDTSKIEGEYQVFFLEKDTFLWVSTGDAVYRLDIHHPYQAAKKVLESRYFRYKVEADADGAVRRLFAYEIYKGLGIFPIKNGHVVYTDNRPTYFSECMIKNVLPESDKHVWLITDKYGLVSLNPAAKNQWRIWGKFASDPIALESWGDKYLIVLSRGKEMFFIDKEKAIISPVACKFIAGDGRAIQSVHYIYLDNAENLWISDEKEGLYYANLRKSKFLSIPKWQSGISGDNYSYWAIKEDKAGDMWIATEPGGIFHLNKQRQLVRRYAHLPGSRNTLPTNRVRDVMPDSEGNVWVATTEGVVQLMPRFEKINLIQTASGETVSVINYIHLTKGGRLLITSEGENNGIFEIKKIKGKTQLSKLLAGTYQTIFEDKNGRLYCSRNSTEICVFNFENDKLMLENSFPVSGLVNGFYEDEQNSMLYFATSNGLVKIDKNRSDAAPEVFTVENGLPSNFIGEMIGMAGQKLWLGTNKGLVFFDDYNNSVRTFSLADGAMSSEFYITAALKRSDGELWFGGSNGITIVPADGKLEIIKNLPQVAITTMSINNVKQDSFPCDITGATNITQIQRIVLPHYENTLSFEFVAIEYSDPVNNKLKYKLYRANDNPSDAAWIQCPNAKGFANFSYLPHGEYVLDIMGANSDAIWNPDPRRLYIKINPPFYKTWWFYSLCLLALAVATYAGVRIYIKNKLRIKNLKIREQRLLIEKQDALTQERNRIAGEMHDDLGGGLTSIRMLSSRVQKKINNPEIQTQVDKIAQYSQELVQKMGEIIWAMNSNFDTVENLIAYIRRYAVDFLEINGLRYHINEPEEMTDYAISGERRRNIYLAVKESLHNIVKHAGAERVTISFNIKDDKLTLRVQDDGKGIDLEQVNQFGNGLHNMRKRLRDVGGEMLVENYEGTLLTFIVPLEKSSS